MNVQQKEKIKRFLEDQVMSEAVREVLLSASLKAARGKDVQSKAAAYYAIEILEDAWKELGKHVADLDTVKSDQINVGL